MGVVEFSCEGLACGGGAGAGVEAGVGLAGVEGAEEEEAAADAGGHTHESLLRVQPVQSGLTSSHC